MTPPDTAPALVALDARMVIIVNGDGEKEVPADKCSPDTRFSDDMNGINQAKI